ncbi:UbiD family decarboxylase [Actinokineospora bangkokensis]|uniref:3-octaprenyl-4-hydroxybenzoate carboxy-lyase n=1 Tax=Actinokineospora bangkokensis TaxID=1193682 RepID=A0A1Q9LTH1_9PSEU|nr:UbiD family decarboxylase [Actinokineospora bangkokensis]OLR95320.1 hypothetical protein BJP25_06030 [Actinokineospora bangkokensis]
MTERPALSLRAAVADARRRGVVRTGSGPAAVDFAARYAGVPATSRTAAEPVVEYPARFAKVLLGLYGDAGRVRAWLPGYPSRCTPAAAAQLLDSAVPPVETARTARQLPVDVCALPAPRVTPRDAGRYITMGVLHARDDHGSALSVHRMLILGPDRLAVWIVPGRGLGALHARALAAGRELPVSVNIGVAPAVMIAAAVNGRFLPPGTAKLDLAGALAGAPVAVAPGATQPVPVLADAEVVLEGVLGAETTDEALGTEVGGSMPEFLGYHGKGGRDLPVLRVTGLGARPGARFQAVVGPGREQSVVLGLGGALSVALSGTGPGWAAVHDLHFPASGGGMVLLVVSLAKTSPADDAAPALLAPQLFAAHPFVRLVVFTDTDVDPTCAEDVWWAVATRSNLGSDCATSTDHAPVPMVPAENPAWRPTGSRPGRSAIDATVPFALRGLAGRALA